MAKKTNLQKILDGFHTHCAPWKLNKKTAEALGYSKKQMLDLRLMNPSITVQWSMQGKGFGEFTFKNVKDKVYCGNECEDKPFIKMMLCKMVDDCILEDKPFSKK